VVANESSKFSQPKLTIGLDLGDRSSWYCVLDEGGEPQWEGKVSTTAKALREAFYRMPRSRIALETGTHSPWVSRLLSELDHEVIVAHARNVRLIGESRRKDDRLDARTLATGLGVSSAERGGINGGKRRRARGSKRRKSSRLTKFTWQGSSVSAVRP
jgi:transposase